MLDVRPAPPSVILPEETGETFAANARLKAEAVFEALDRRAAVLADDSGLEVLALNGRPGVQSARFAGVEASDEDNVKKLLGDLGDRADRRARFVCALCLIIPVAGPDGGESVIAEVEGFSEGDITGSPRGGEGFGYDPVFRPVGWESTLAEASPVEKDAVSHRGAAARALISRLSGLGWTSNGA